MFDCASASALAQFRHRWLLLAAACIIAGLTAAAAETRTPAVGASLSHTGGSNLRSVPRANAWAAFVTGGILFGAVPLAAMALWTRALRMRAHRRTSELHSSLERQAEQAGVLARAQLDAGVRARQQATVASLGQRALAGIDVQLLIDQTASVVCDTLQVAATGVFESCDDGAALLLRAGHGWSDASVGVTRLANSAAEYPGAVLATESAVVSSGAMHEFFTRQQLTVSAGVKIPGLPRPFGVLLVADRGTRQFSRDDLHFLHAIANVIGAAFERAAVEKELRTAIAINSATLEAVADGIFVTDASGRVTRYNQRFVDMMTLPPDALANTPNVRDWAAWAAARSCDPARTIENFEAAFNSDSVHSAVITMSDGRVFERHSQPHLVDGRIVGRVWCYSNLTDRVRAEEERRRLEAQMQHVQKLESLGVLAGGIAHDFNNLLVGILGNAGLAAMEAPGDSPALERLRQIEKAAQRAAELTNQMLAYSGKGRFVVQRIDLSALVGETADLLHTAISKNAQLEFSLATDLPAFEGDAAQIRQVVMNLITNASDAIGDAAGRIAVRTGACHVSREYLTDAFIGADRPEGAYVFVEVRDNGCGMDGATLARIFDPFFTTKFTGRGLGLAAVLGIVRGHSGVIKIATAPGRGTAFRVLLPSASHAPIAAPSPVAAAPSRAPTGRILIVDDEPSVRRVASEVLARAGFAVDTAGDGEEAVEIVRRQGVEFQAVLLDMTMPRMNGAEAFKVIRKISPSLSVVLTSGYSEQDAATRFGIDGLAGFIQKPFLPSTLVTVMTQAVNRTVGEPVR